MAKVMDPNESVQPVARAADDWQERVRMPDGELQAAGRLVGGWWAVTPRGDKLDLAHGKGKPVAVFEFKEHAEEFARRYLFVDVEEIE